MERVRTANFTLPLGPLGVVLGAFAVTILGMALLPPRQAFQAPSRTNSVNPSELGNLLGRYDVTVETVAGSEPGFRDGAGWEARFSGPNALALEPGGSLLVCDSRNHRIRRITADRKVETVVGGGPAGGSGGRALGAAQEARLRYPSGVVCDPSGTLYIADTGNHRICRLRDGTLSLLAGGTRGTRDGAGAAAAFEFPAALYYDPAGAIWVADAGSGKIRRVSLAGVTTTPAAAPKLVTTTLGRSQRDGERTEVQGWQPGGNQSESLDQLWIGRRSGGMTLALQPSTRDYQLRRGGATRELFADPENHVLMAERSPEPPTVLAGCRTPSGGLMGSQDGTGETATFAAPAALARSGSVLYVADYEGNRIRRVTLPAWLFTTEEPPRLNR